MYVAKESNSGYAVYRSEQDPNSPGRLARIRDLRQAIETDQLLLHFQPKLAFDRSRVDAVEALARWHHPEHGWVPADQIIPLAERTGLIRPLSMWVLNCAIRQVARWHAAHHHIRIAVNLSARNLHDPDLARTVEQLLRKWRVESHWLTVEITESAIMVDPDRAMETLVQIHDMGIHIAIDDFGTGYSSLAYLKRLPADEIKIDKSFVIDMARNEDDAFIARSVIDLGHNLGLKVVAEGVENEATWNLLRQMGCDVAQGYYVSRPLATCDLMDFLNRNRGAGTRIAV
jgi:EAL domain-containing protein (putative c-di-GMP-specific phosphodiesterase class I)